MMIVLLFLFQFSMVIRDTQNQYDVNDSYTPKQADGGSAWKGETLSVNSLSSDSPEYVLFVGDGKSSMAESVGLWCQYAKRNLVTCASLSECPNPLSKLPSILILESEKQAEGEAFEQVKDMEAHGVTVIFGSLLDADQIAEDEELMQFLGIRKVEAEETKLTGVKLFSGFLLGGETVYQAQNKKEAKERQDFDLTVPWYQTGDGTKVYMTGLFADKKMKNNGGSIENEELPALIWRSRPGEGFVFSICGDYMKDGTAIGLLDGMIFDTTENYIYPVVNAQNLSVVDFPGFADENEEEMQKRYSRSATAVGRDIIWPALEALADQSNLKMTCFFMPQGNLEDAAKPDGREYVFYLKQMKEMGAEAGISLNTFSALDFAKKLALDESFYTVQNNQYQFGAAFIDGDDLSKALEETDSSILDGIGTYVCDKEDGNPVISYCLDSVTLQSATSDGVTYTYRDDFKMRSIQSALGYTNVMLSMQKVFWPEDDSDNWQIMQEKFSSNLLTYWKPFPDFESTTISESDQRVRTFLNLDYQIEQKENEIRLKASDTGRTSYFILRTHEDEVADVDHGSFIKLEDGAYLITLLGTEGAIHLKTEGLHYYAS